jgi:hypothetical protein
MDGQYIAIDVHAQQVWKHILKLQRHERLRSWIKCFFSLLLLLVVLYVVFSLTSLAEISQGEKIQYMPFWHQPWVWLLERLK